MKPLFWKSFPAARLLWNLLAFTAPWAAYYIGHGLLLGFPGSEWFLPNLLVPLLFLACAGAVFTYFDVKSDSLTAWRRGSSDLRGFLIVLILTAADQGIKLFLFSLDWKHLRIPILPGFSVAPVLNSYGSYLASILRVTIPIHAYFVLYALTAVVYFEGFRYYMRSGRRGFWTVGAMILFFSGLLSVFLDNLIHRGSLDYLLIEPLFTCDLKDFYLTFGVIFILAETIEHSKAVRAGERSDDLDFRFGDFLAFMKNDASRILKSLTAIGRRTSNRRKRGS